MPEGREEIVALLALERAEGIGEGGGGCAVGGRGAGESGGGCVGEREQVQFTQGILHTRTWKGPHGQIRCPPCILY